MLENHVQKKLSTLPNKVAGVEEAIALVGAHVFYLPPYSPDFNPIENVFSMLKTMLRNLKSRAMEDLWKNLGELCDIFTPKEYYNYYKNAGYRKIKIPHQLKRRSGMYPVLVWT